LARLNLSPSCESYENPGSDIISRLARLNLSPSY
jgi:hypothetical protein